MEQKRNFQREMEQEIENNKREGKVPTLLLHSCCAPCSSYVLESLTPYFHITVLYYNPNISPREEYEKRKAEQIRLLGELPVAHPVSFMDCDYDAPAYLSAVSGYEACPEGGDRCRQCFALRLGETARRAKEGGFDYFTTTLSISPHKNAQVLNEIGEEMARRYEVSHLPADFKKKEGYKRSIVLSGRYGLYRQNYCGCIFTKP